MSRPSATPRPDSGASAVAARAAAAKVPAAELARATAGRSPRVVDASLPAATLVGKVRLLAAGLIGNNGGGVIGQNGGGVVSNNGGAVISNNGGKIVSDNGGGVVGTGGGGVAGSPRYAIRQATPAAEASLADAVVTVHDAAGRMLSLPDGTPIVALTDQTGAYKLEAPLPAENLVLRVRLWTGGELAAMAPRQAGAQREHAIDTATSLGAAYVLERFVKGDQRTFDRLPANEAVALRQAIDEARGALAGTLRYEPLELVSAAELLRREAPPVARKLEEIKALLIGQAALGEGRRATEVALPPVRDMLVDRQGNLVVGGWGFGRLRAVAPDGVLTTLIDGTQGTRAKANFLTMAGMCEGPEGSLYVASGGQVYRITLGGDVTPVAGRTLDRVGRSPGDGKATEVSMHPIDLVLDAGGTLWVLDVSQDRGGVLPPRLLAVGPDGMSREVSAGLTSEMTLEALALGTDGSPLGLLAVDDGLLVGPLREGAPFTPLARVPAADGTLDVAPDGTVWVACREPGALYAIAPGGEVRTLIGEGGDPSGPAVPDLVKAGPDGTLYITDAATPRIFARSPAGAWRVVAGTAGAVQQAGETTEIALNRPFNVAFDEQGRLLFTDSGGFAVKRFDGANVETVVGAGIGDAGDGGPALAARLRAPSGLAYRDGTMWILDEGNHRLRKVGPDGRITTAMGGRVLPGMSPGKSGLATMLRPGERLPPDRVSPTFARAVAVGPDGRPYVALSESGQVWRLGGDGLVELVAGLPTEVGATSFTKTALGVPTDGMPASEAPLLMPSGLAFDATGDLLVSDLVACRIWRVTGLSGDRPTIRAHAGLPLPDVLGMLGRGLPPWAGQPATAAALLTPLGVAVDARGRTLVGAVGGRQLRTLLPVGDTADILQSEVGSSVGLIGVDGRIQPVVGANGRYLPDATAEDALQVPSGLAFAVDGRVALADAGASLVRIYPAGAF